MGTVVEVLKKHYKSDICESYIDDFVSRSASFSTSIREEDSFFETRKKDYKEAFLNLLDYLNIDGELNEEIIKMTAEKVNQNAIYISTDYRKIGSTINDTNILITEPSSIESEMNTLLHLYHNDWKSLNPYEKEAKFYLRFIEIHPFEDGNGRTASLLNAFNLLSQGLPPSVLDKDKEETVLTCVRNKDIDTMKNLLFDASQKEANLLENHPEVGNFLKTSSK